MDDRMKLNVPIVDYVGLKEFVCVRFSFERCCNLQLVDYIKAVMDNYFIHQVSTLPNTQFVPEWTKGKLPLLAPTLA